jgi:hypothetical protein
MESTKELKKRKVEPFYNFVRWAWSYARQVMHPKTRNGQPGESLDGLDKIFRSLSDDGRRFLLELESSRRYCPYIPPDIIY